VVHGATTCAAGATPAWFRMSMWTYGVHTGHGDITFKGRGLTSKEIGVAAELTAGNTAASPNGTASELTLQRGPAGAEVLSRQVRNVMNVGPKSADKVRRSLVQMKAAAIPGIPTYGRPGQAIALPRRSAFEQDSTLYYQVAKAFRSKGASSSSLGALQAAVAAAFAAYGCIALHVNATINPPAWNITISSPARLALADMAHKRAYWGIPSSATDSTHNATEEGGVLHTSMVQDLHDTTTMVAVGLSSGETTVTASWFRTDYEHMVQQKVNPTFTLAGTYVVHDAASALISAAIIFGQYTLADPWHVFQLVMKLLPAIRVTHDGLSPQQIEEQG